MNAIFAIAIVTVSKLNANTWDRGFCIALAVVVVIRIRGNAFHSCCASIAAQEFLDGGGRLGFNPLAPAIAAATAITPPAVVLGIHVRNRNLVTEVGMD
ncbi:MULTISPECIES: hypothetical protein [Rhodococcus]|uniref:hypothetical protein n=1 Tax=Rhodococcus TaxID=1827 RepID=UPI0003006493|nr:MULTISPECIES: hypothetical protein [Rhodococcus]MBY6382463.1 hypothetical protein [Rhodococcus erythropolis]MDI9960776.1 hypothetical protein [Rhodococcus sp. IEGM 1237]MDI9966801.1 hypothetical protein [Rhodococcus sp. IEGM 1251]MDV8129262.1 hypothetical protein [Rhodococcus sp. IEGM 1304]ORI27793.1 hypothetical protein BH686_05415 [Rhodococcus erythropolis]